MSPQSAEEFDRTPSERRALHLEGVRRKGNLDRHSYFTKVTRMRRSRMLFYIALNMAIVTGAALVMSPATAGASSNLICQQDSECTGMTCNFGAGICCPNAVGGCR